MIDEDNFWGNGAPSQDGYVRIPTSALSAVTLNHLISEKDPSITVDEMLGTQTHVAGYTEWVGTWGRSQITVGWDWAVIDDVVVIVNPNEIRTNILLMGEDSRPEPPGRAKVLLLEWIETFRWRQIAIMDLLK